MAVLVTHLAASMGSLTWNFSEYLVTGKHTVMGMIKGALSGLVGITPGSGFVDCNGGIFIGIISGMLCFGAAHIKDYFDIDDSSDALGIHVVGGVIGGILIAFFARKEFGGVDGIFYAGDDSGGHLLGKQIYGIVVTSGWSCFVSYALLLFVNTFLGMRVSESEEREGLDVKMHGEEEVVAKPQLMLGIKTFDSLDEECPAPGPVSPKGTFL
jgi:Amt family ammonium transporter